MAKQEKQFGSGLDIKKLRAMSKDLTKKAGGGDGLLWYANKLGEEDNARILPPPEEANGVYFVEQAGWWISGKFYVTNDTEILGGEDVIEQEIELAKNSEDEDIIALVNKKKNGMPLIKKEYRSLVPVLQLDVIYDDDDELVECKVVDARLLVAKPTLLDSIHKVVTHRQYQNKTFHGIADRVKGSNIILSKTGTGKETKYSSMGWNSQMEMDEKWYDAKKIPNAFEYTRKYAKTDEVLRSIIRNYLYGEAIIEDANSGSSDTKETATEKNAEKMEKTASSGGGHKRQKISDNVEEEKSAPKKSTGRSLLDDAASGSGGGVLDDL